MRKSYTERLRVTKKGKVMRRAMGLGHSRASKNSTQMGRKKASRGVGLPNKVIKRHIH
jgi:ribosomal protein L35